MKYILQILYIMLFSLAGEALQALVPLPIPAAIYGIVLLFTALATGILKEEKIAETAQFLISWMPMLFVAPAVKILQYWELIAPNIAAILIITAASTVLVFAVSGLVIKWLRGSKEDSFHD